MRKRHPIVFEVDLELEVYFLHDIHIALEVMRLDEEDGFKAQTRFSKFLEVGAIKSRVWKG